MPQEKIVEGKTKIIWSTDVAGIVSVENKDIITAGDGAKRDSIENKGVLATETTCNCFSLLNKAGVPTHFVRRDGERSFLALYVKMIPIELVARRIATGSYLQRHPGTKEGTIFPDLVLESFYKDDSLHDPLINWNGRQGSVELYNAHVPWGPRAYLINLGTCSLLTPWGDRLCADYFKKFAKITHDVFLILEKSWEQQGVTLVDLKIECGWTETGELVVADVIDNDSWRIWPAGDKAKMKDKQVYRNLEHSTPEALNAIKKNYAWVADSTRRFIS